MREKTELSQDQDKRISATLRRIRGGLQRDQQGNQTDPFEEPAHIFRPEVFDAENK